MNIDAYLDRLAYKGPRDPTAATLRALHTAHLLAVPFENLDIGLGRAIRLDQDALFDKIVRRRRGGFCYELNGLFAALLTGLGFDVTLLSARVYNDGQFGPEFDHLALLVRPADTPSEAWLADVGFGDCFVQPLRFTVGEQAHTERQRTYRLSSAGERWLLEERRGAEPFEHVYDFSLQPYVLADFAAMCRFQQTSPESSFTRRRICTRATPTGRLTLSDRRLILTHAEERQEQELPDDDAFTMALTEHFGGELALSESEISRFRLAAASPPPEPGRELPAPDLDNLAGSP